MLMTGFLFLFGVLIGQIPFMNFFMAIVNPILGGGLVYACDQYRKTEQLRFGMLFQGFRQHTSSLLGLGVATLLFMLTAFFLTMLTAGTDVAMAMFSGDPKYYEVVMVNAMRSFWIAFLFYLAFSMLFYAALWFATPLVMLHGVPVSAAMWTSFFASFRNAARLSGFDTPFESGNTCGGRLLYGSGNRM